MENKKRQFKGTSLVAQWIRIRLPVQGTWVSSLVWEDSNVTEQLNYWVEQPNHWAREPNYQAPVLQLLKTNL